MSNAAIQSDRSLFARGFQRTLQYGSFFLAVVSVTKLILVASNEGPAVSLSLLFDWYDAVVELVRAALEPWLHPVIAWIAARIDVGLTLSPYWHHLFAPMLLYFNSEAFTNKLRMRRANLWAGILLSTPLAMLSGVHIPSSLLGDGIASDLVSPVSATVFFALLQTYLTSKWDRPASETFWRTFRYYTLWTLTPHLLIGANVIMAGLITDAYVTEAERPAAVVIIMLTFVVAMASYFLLRATLLADTDRSAGESWGDRFRRTGGYTLGSALLSVVAGAIAVTLVNAGLKTIGL
jgi:succinate dehydrogenase hydrophobic anchor subunit